MSQLRFYTNSFSTYCTRVRFFLEEAGRAYEAIPVSFNKRGELPADYRQQYELNKVPSIEISGFRLGESNAILRYLAQKWERFDLYPANLEARAEVDQWMDFLNQHACKYLGELAWYRHWMHKFSHRIPVEADAHAEKNLRGYLEKIDSHLQTRSYIVGFSISLADISWLPFLALLPQCNMNLKAYPAIAKYAERLFERDAWKRVLLSDPSVSP